MTHRIDLKMLGFESVKYGNEQEIKKLAKQLDDKDITKEIVKVNENVWELYVKKQNNEKTNKIKEPYIRGPYKNKQVKK